MAEMSPVPMPKTRLILSVVVAIIGLVVLYGVEPFENQMEIGWVILAIGLVSVIYNVYCLMTGKQM